jgi:hypothetical protein
MISQVLQDQPRRESQGALGGTPLPSVSTIPSSGTIKMQGMGSLYPFAGPLGSGSSSLLFPLRMTPTTLLPLVVPGPGSSLSPQMSIVLLPGPSSLGDRRSLTSEGKGSELPGITTAGVEIRIRSARPTECISFPGALGRGRGTRVCSRIVRM